MPGTVLAAAERAFQAPEPGRDPEFISYFTEAEFAAEIAHCFRDLGDARRADEHAALAVPSDGQYARSDFFVTMVLRGRAAPTMATPSRRATWHSTRCASASR